MAGLLMLAGVVHAKSSCSDSCGMCRVGGYETINEPVIFYYHGNIVMAESNWVNKPDLIAHKTDESSHGDFRIYNVTSKTLTPPVPFTETKFQLYTGDAIPEAITSGAAAGGKAYIGGANGLFASDNLTKWTPVPGVSGNVAKLLPDGDDLWVGMGNEILRLHDGTIAERHSYEGEKVAGLGKIGDKLFFNLVDKTTPPSGFCEPYRISKGLEMLDLKSGKVTGISSSLNKESAAIRGYQSTQTAEAVIIFTQGFLNSEAHTLDLKTFKLSKSTIPYATSFISWWLAENSGNKNAANDLAGLVEKLYAQQDFLYYFPFWNDVFNWLYDNKDYERLKRMYIAASSRNKLQLLQSIGYKKDPFALEMLTMAYERHEYFRDDLMRLITSHKEPGYDELLERILRETPSQQPESYAKGLYSDLCGLAADELIKRQGEKIVPLVEKLADDPSTVAQNQKFLEGALDKWSWGTRHMGYKPQRWIRAEHATPTEAMALLDDPDPYIREQAIQKLQYVTTPVPLKKLLAAFAEVGKNGMDMEGPAINAISISTDPAAGDALLSKFDNSKGYLRVLIMIGLARRKDPRIFPILTGELNDTNSDVRIGAIRALGYLQDKRAIPFLLNEIKRTDVKDTEPGIWAIDSLGHMGDEEDLIALSSNSSAQWIRASAQQSLANLHGGYFQRVF